MNCELRIANCELKRMGLASILSAAMLFAQPRPAIADDLQAFAAFQKTRLTEVEAAHAKILDTYRSDPALEDYSNRLRIMDETAELLIREFTRVKSVALDVLVEDPLGKTPAKAPGKTPMPSSFAARSESAAKAPMDAQAILDRYQDEFARPLALPGLTKTELETLKNYYDLRAKAASEFIAEKGKPITAVNPKQSTEVLELCLVIPFLHVPDASWTQAECDLLPEWMKSAANLQKIERFSLRCRRPMTAYQFAIVLGKLQKKAPEDLLAYFQRSAEKAVSDREYHCAIQCYRSAIAEGRSQKKDDLTMSLQIALAELLARLEHAQLAADEVKAAMGEHPSSDEFGRASVLRLKFLYESGQFEQVTSESPGLQKDDRCSRHLPQIMYIHWVSARRLNRQEKSQEICDKFLELFPQHPLCADLYFAMAMSKLAEGKHDEAGKLLEIVEVRFPKSTLVPKVKEIRSRLQQVSTMPA